MRPWDPTPSVAFAGATRCDAIWKGSLSPLTEARHRRDVAHPSPRN